MELDCHQCHLCPHMVEASQCPLFIAELLAGKVKSNFYRLWFDPSRSRTRVDSFSTRRSIDLTSYWWLERLLLKR